MSAPIRLAVFDCDGTLVDGQHDICAAMDAAFASLALPLPDRQQVRRVVGLSLPAAIRRLLPDAEPALQAATVEGYKQAYRAARMEGRVAEPLFPGIHALVTGLATAGWTLGVATGKSDRGLTHCLASHGLTDLFATLQTADRHPSKPHPAMLEAAMDHTLALPEHTVMIGDTSYDMAMAHSIGVRALGVAWGYHTEAELIESGAETVAQTPEALARLLA